MHGFQLAYDSGIPVKTSFLFIAFVFTTTVVSTFWFMPRHHVPFEPPLGYRLNFGCCNRTPPVMGMVVTERQLDRKELADEIESVVRREKGESFKTIAVSKLFFLDVLWLTCQRFQSFSFVGRLNPTLDRLANNDKGIGKNCMSRIDKHHYGICAYVCARTCGRACVTVCMWHCKTLLLRACVCTCALGWPNIEINRAKKMRSTEKTVLKL